MLCSDTILMKRLIKALDNIEREMIIMNKKISRPEKSKSPAFR